MSRTRKDRPYWVLKNDPSMERYASHDHLVLQTEWIGEEPVYRRALSKDGWHWEDKLYYTRQLYKRWYVAVDCTLDIPEGTPSTWRLNYPRVITNEDRLADKHCYWNLEYYPNVKSHKDFKKLTNGAVRSKVKQKLHTAVRDYGRYWEDGDWEDIDVFEDSKYNSSQWWD